MEQHPVKKIQRVISSVVIGIFTISTALPAWGYSVTTSHFRPPMAEQDGGTMKGLRDDLTARDVAKEGGIKVAHGTEKIAERRFFLQRQLGQLTWDDLEGDIGNLSISSQHDNSVTVSLFRVQIPRDREPINVTVSPLPKGESQTSLVEVKVFVDASRTNPEGALRALLAHTDQFPAYLGSYLRVYAYNNAPHLLLKANSSFREKRAGLERLRRDLGTTLGMNEGDAAAVETIGRQRDEVEEALATLAVGQEILPTLDRPLTTSVITRSAKEEAPEVLGYEISYFAYNPDAYVNLWRHIRQIPDFGKPGKSGVVVVLLPYSIRKGVGLTGIDPQNLREALNALNTFATQHSGEKVDLTPEDFGVVVPSERLVDIQASKDYIEGKTGGYPLTKIFARKQVADAFKALKSLVAFVFELPFKGNEAGIDNLDKALLARLEDGQEFVDPSIQNVSAGAANALLELRNTLAGL